MSDDTPDPYELLGIQPDATEQQIKTAYRQRSLKVHPDRHPNNPDAAAKFHELNQAYNLLLDPTRKTALDDSLRVKRARAERFKSYDAKRRNLQEDLEARERAFKKARLDKASEERRREQEIERVKEEGRQRLREREAELAREAKTDAEQSAPPAQLDGLGPLDSTVRVKYILTAHPDLSTPTALAARLEQFGVVDTPVLSLKPKRKKNPDGPMNVTAVVHFERIIDAYAAVCASDNSAKGMNDIEVTWAGGSEPEVLATLKNEWAEARLQRAVPDASNADDVLRRLKTFSATRSSPSDSSPLNGGSHPSRKSPPVGFDFESITLFKMREMERTKLEQQILAQEAGDS